MGDIVKRFLSLLLALCLLTGCANFSDSETSSEPKTFDISDGISRDRESFYYEFDFDSDGEEEVVEMDVRYDSMDHWEGGDLIISVGDYSTKLEIAEGTIEKVYACDIDTEDGVYDIAVITCEYSGDPRLRILNYDPDLTPYKFYYEHIADDNWIGYAISYYFNVNDDGSITIEEQTPSYGMWSVYRTYERDDDGVFCEIVPKKYEILPDFMEDAYTENMSGKELEMWEKGYIKAYTDYDGDDITIEKGDYVKVLYDDGENSVYFETEDGSGEWVDIGYMYSFDAEFRPDEFNPHFFYLAG